MIKKMWRWLTLADLQKEAEEAAETSCMRSSMWFTMTSQNSRTEFSACCAEHLYAGLKNVGFAGLLANVWAEPAMIVAQENKEIEKEKE